MIVLNLDQVADGIAKSRQGGIGADAINITRIIGARFLRVSQDSAANGMGITCVVGEIGLNAIGHDVLVYLCRHPVVKKVSVDVRIELHRAVTVHLRKLKRKIVDGLLVGDEAIVGLFVLRFVQAG